MYHILGNKAKLNKFKIHVIFRVCSLKNNGIKLEIINRKTIGNLLQLEIASLFHLPRKKSQKEIKNAWN